MTIIQKVRDVLEANAGTAMTTAEIEANLKGITREQISSALWRLRTEEDCIKQVRIGVHKYLGPSERMPKLAKTLEAHSEVFEQEKPEDGKYYTEVGTAKNGDKILTNDATGETYRATPL